MATFEEFVQTELPTRPFALTDGLAGQIPVRSANPERARELVWVDYVPGGGGSGGAGSGELLDGGNRLTGVALFDGGSRT